MPFLPNLAVFLGISVWYLVPTYWIAVDSLKAIWQSGHFLFLALEKQQPRINRLLRGLFEDQHKTNI